MRHRTKESGIKGMYKINVDKTFLHRVIGVTDRRATEVRRVSSTVPGGSYPVLC